MQMYHADCPESIHGRWSWWRRLKFWRPALHQGVSRLRRVRDHIEDDRTFCVMTFRCEYCRTQIHIDTDWPDEQGHTPLLGRE
jgi:hypothetical protein